MYFVVFSTNLDWGRTNNGVEQDSINCSIPERGFNGAWSCWVFGHNSGGRSWKISFMARSKEQTSDSVSESDSLFCWGRFGWNWSKLIGWLLTGIKLVSSGCIGVGVWTTWGDLWALVYLPMSSWDWEVFDEEEGIIDRLLLFLRECLDLFEFFFRREELKEPDLEVEEEDDRCLLLFFDLWSLFDCSFLEGLVRYISGIRRINHHTRIWDLRKIRFEWNYLFGGSSWIWELWSFRVFISRKNYIW